MRVPHFSAPRVLKAVLRFLPLCHAARAAKWQNENASPLCAGAMRSREMVYQGLSAFEGADFSERRCWR
jgi:hypothetical protein